MARNSIHDPDADLDATAIVQNMLHGHQEPSPAPRTTWTPPEHSERRMRRSRGRQYSADSIPGLADYFTAACPPLSWSGGLEIGNRQALMQVLGELRRDVGLTPADCRTLIDLYVTRLCGKSPSKPYVWDFKWQRYRLLKALRDTGATLTAEDYGTWEQPAPNDPAAGDSFAASWGEVQ